MSKPYKAGTLYDNAAFTANHDTITHYQRACLPGVHFTTFPVFWWPCPNVFESFAGIKLRMTLYLRKWIKLTELRIKYIVFVPF